MWKNTKFSLTENFFRQISSLVTSLLKTLISRNFCQKCVIVNFRNFHTALCISLFFGKNFVKTTFTLIILISQKNITKFPKRKKKPTHFCNLHECCVEMVKYQGYPTCASLSTTSTINATSQ